MVRVWDYHTFRYIYSNEVVVWRRIPMKISNLSTFMHYIALLHIADYILCTHKYTHVMPKIFSRSPGSTQATHSCGLIKLIRVVRNKRPISTVSVETWKDGFDGAKWHGRYQINHTYIYMYIIYIYIIIQIYENEVLNVLKQYHAFCCSLQCGVGARSRARYIPLPPNLGSMSVFCHCQWGFVTWCTSVRSITR